MEGDSPIEEEMEGATGLDSPIEEEMEGANVSGGPNGAMELDEGVDDKFEDSKIEHQYCGLLN